MSASTLDGGACGYCGMIHQGVCPKVKSIEYHPDGSVKRVEFNRVEPKVEFTNIDFDPPSLKKRCRSCDGLFMPEKLERWRGYCQSCATRVRCA